MMYSANNAMHTDFAMTLRFHTEDHLREAGDGGRSCRVSVTRGKSKRVLVVTCVLGLVTMLASAQAPRVSAYTQLTNWLPLIPLTEETPTCAKAKQCVRDLGTNAIPALLVLLREQDTNFLRPGGIGRSQGLATFGFGILGSVAAPAVTGLVQCMDDERPWVRATAATCLREIGEPASNAVPRLVAALSDPSPDVQLSAVLALAIVPGKPEQMVPGLVSFLEASHPEGDKGDWGQTAAIAALGRYDAAHTAQAIPVLRRMTNASSTIVRSRARGLLATIESPPKPILQPETAYDEALRKFPER